MWLPHFLTLPLILLTHPLQFILHLLESCLILYSLHVLADMCLLSYALTVTLSTPLWSL
jgi:hypothetical protein